jgi:D-arabinose 1-dehydrogenase-like Zn-dependent alcohol dehydrogenase
VDDVRHDGIEVEVFRLIDGRDAEAFQDCGIAGGMISPTTTGTFVHAFRGGMVGICAGTSGYNLTMDARYLWMHQKRVQGSHFASLLQTAQPNKLVVERRIDPCMSEVFGWDQIPKAHMRMLRDGHKPGNMAVLVNARRRGCARRGRA